MLGALHVAMSRYAGSRATTVPGIFSDDEQSLAGDAEESAPDTYQCFACEVHDGLDNLPECHSSRLFHRTCWSGIRSYMRTLPKDRDTTVKYKHKFLHNPVAWRADVRPYLQADAESRKQARLDTRRKLYEMTITSRVSADENIDDRLVLTQVQFEAHVGFWEKLSEKEAQAKFRRILAEQDGAHSKDGVDKIAYEGIGKIRSREGTEVRQSVKDTQEVSESVAEIKRRRIIGKTCDAVSVSSGTPRHRSPRRESDGTPTVMESRSREGTPSSKWQLKVAQPKKRDEELRQTAPSQLSPKEFMQRQELMAAACDEAMGHICGKRGALSDIERFVESMDEKSLQSDIHKKTPDIVTSLKDAKTTIEDLKGKVESASTDSMIKLENDIQAAVKHLEGIKKIASDHKEALQFKQDSTKKQARQQYLHDRYQIVKYQGYMTTVNFPKGLAKVLAGRVHKLGCFDDSAQYSELPDFQADAGDMDFAKVQLWMSPADAPVVRQVVRATAKADDGSRIKASTDKAEVAMAKNKKWTGCTQMIDVASMKSLDFSEVSAATEVQHDGTCGPWVCTSKKWAYRFGPAAMPLTGFPHFVQSYDGDWIISTFRVELLLSQGIVLHDFDNFVKTDAGVSFMAEHAPSFRLNKGCVMYIPMGHVVLQTLANDLKNESGCGHLLAYHVLSAPLVKQVSLAVWNGVTQVNEEYFKTRTDSLSKHLSELLGAFMEHVAKAREEW